MATKKENFSYYDGKGNFYKQGVLQPKAKKASTEPKKEEKAKKAETVTKNTKEEKTAEK